MAGKPLFPEGKSSALETKAVCAIVVFKNIKIEKI